VAVKLLFKESLTGQQFHQYHQQNEQSPLTEHKKRKQNKSTSCDVGDLGLQTYFHDENKVLKYKPAL
jgi:hypothetical protein